MVYRNYAASQESWQLWIQDGMFYVTLYVYVSYDWARPGERERERKKNHSVRIQGILAVLLHVTRSRNNFGKHLNPVSS